MGPKPHIPYLVCLQTIFGSDQYSMFPRNSRCPVLDTCTRAQISLLASMSTPFQQNQKNLFEEKMTDQNNPIKALANQNNPTKTMSSQNNPI